MFREEVRAGERNQAPRRETAPDDVPWRRRIAPDPVLLFRFSALTFNSHRIHYDRPWAMEREGYTGLVVHGPLTSTLLIDFARDQNPGARLDGLRDPGPGPALRYRALRAARSPHRGRSRGRAVGGDPRGHRGHERAGRARVTDLSMKERTIDDGR